eukprot:2758297-Amphidinium_carterae.1
MQVVAFACSMLAMTKKPTTQNETEQSTNEGLGFVVKLWLQVFGLPTKATSPLVAGCWMMASAQQFALRQGQMACAT